MGRETKVGLLAGLTFITCFAVILANRGRDRFSDLGAWPAVVSGLASATPTVDRAPPAPTQIPPNASGPAQRVAILPTQTRLAQTNPAVDHPASIPTGASPGSPSNAAASGQASEPAVILRRPPDPAPVAPPAAERTGAAPDSNRLAQAPQGVDAGEQERILRDRLAKVSAAWASRTQAAQPTTLQGVTSPRPEIVGGPAAGAPPAQSVPAHNNSLRPEPSIAQPADSELAERSRRAVLARHSVQKGDTLTRIAGRYYGAATAHHIDAICDANRGVLADRNRLKVGDEVVIPTLQEGVVVPTGAPAARPAPAVGRNAQAAIPPSEPSQSDTGGASTSNRSATSSAAQERTTGSDVRWYQVRKSDRYVSIAREQLGDERRWKEIFELNRDRFPDPARIREGVRIRLPER